jgi:FkbM family methyltransferase
MISRVKFRITLIVVVLLVGASVAYSNYAPFRLFTYVIAGRSPVCPLGEALKSGTNLRRQVEYKDKILNASKLLEQDPKGFELWETPKGKFWIPQGSRYVLPFNLAEQERKIYGSGEFGPHSGDVILDCGANIGVTVREELSAGAKQIVAIEPGPENLECLRRNYPDEIKSGRVVVYPKGVWDKEDFLTFRVDPKNSAADSFVIQREGAVELEKVPLTTIDKLVNELKLERVDYVKLDIEGAEPKALAGAHDTLAKWRPRISIAAYHAPDHPQVIPTLIRAARADYVMQCGPCAEANNGVRPDVLYFK